MKRQLRYNWKEETWLDEEGGATLSLDMTEEQKDIFIAAFDANPTITIEDMAYIPIYLRDRVKVAVQVGRTLKCLVEELSHEAT